MGRGTTTSRTRITMLAKKPRKAEKIEFFATSDLPKIQKNGCLI
jgi:hypothetical protein